MRVTVAAVTAIGITVPVTCDVGGGSDVTVPLTCAVGGGSDVST